MTGDSSSRNTRRDAAHRCDWACLSDTEKRRRELLLEWLQVGISEVFERPDGYAFWLDPACHITKHLEELIAVERRCCPFLCLHVQEAPEHDGPVLEIRGAEGVKEFVAGQLGIRGHAG